MDNLFEGKGLFIKGIVHLSPKEAQKEAQNGALLIDIREQYDTDYKKFDVPEVLYVSFHQFDELKGAIPKDRALIVADSIGQRGKEIVEKLIKEGFVNIANLNGGMMDWERDGMPIKIDNSKKLSGSCTCRLRPQGK